jgi:large subunit ribosomal protein L54
MEMSKEVCTGVNIFTEGEDPELKPDDEYPDWLWDLAQPKPSVKQLKQKLEEVGFEAFPYEDYRRLLKLERRAVIKAHNSANKKK